MSTARSAAGCGACTSSRRNAAWLSHHRSSTTWRSIPTPRSRPSASCRPSLQGWRMRRLLALLTVIALFAVTPLDAAAAKKRRRVTRKKGRAVAAAPSIAGTAVGATLGERLQSLMNGPTGRSSEASLQVVEVDSGTVVAERTPHTPLAPASNMKLFTTGAAIDLLKPTFQITTTVYARGQVQPSGTLEGDLKVVGHGDPTIGGALAQGRHAPASVGGAAHRNRAGGQSHP